MGGSLEALTYILLLDISGGVLKQSTQCILAVIFIINGEEIQDP